MMILLQLLIIYVLYLKLWQQQLKGNDSMFSICTAPCDSVNDDDISRHIPFLLI